MLIRAYISCSLFLLFFVQVLFAQVPTITTLSSYSGSPGTTITINGIGFSANTSKNIVYFGPVQGEVVSASTNAIIVKIPNGAAYSNISVLNLDNGLMSSTRKAFSPIFGSKKNITIKDFKTKIDVSHPNPTHIAFDDLDLDGKSDMLVVNAGSNSISIYKNNFFKEESFTSTSFNSKVDIVLPSAISKVKLADLDGDGKRDIIALSTTGNQLFLLKSKISANSLTSDSFEPPIVLPMTDSPEDFVIGDLNGDGKQEIVVANSSANYFTVFVNNTTQGILNLSSFTTGIQVITGSKPKGITVGDFNNDGLLDLVTTNSGNHNVTVFLNNSTGGIISVGAKLDFVTDLAPVNVVVADFDQDDNLDISTLNYGNTVTILRNNGIGTTLSTTSFANKIVLPIQYNNTSLAISDIDADEKPDIVVANSVQNCVYVVRNMHTNHSLSTFSFDSPIKIATGTAPSTVAITDLDNDGKQDIITASQFNQVISLIKNVPSIPPVIFSYSPMKADIGSVITIKGQNFNSDPLRNAVYISGVKAVVSAASITELKVIIPSGISHGKITVTNLNQSATATASIQFTPTFPSINQVTTSDFRPSTEIANDSWGVSATASGDLDGDGKMDYIVMNTNTSMVSIYRNITSKDAVKASFAPRINFAAESGGAINIVDYNGDGKLDVVIIGDYLTVLINNGSAGILSTSSFTKMSYSGYLGPVVQAKLADLNEDGKPDIVFVGASSGIVFLRNISEPGDLTKLIDYKSSEFPQYKFVSLELEDLNGDGKPEIIAGNEYESNIVIFKNISSSSNKLDSYSFAEPISYNLGGSQLAIGDFNSDGKNDIVCSAIGLEGDGTAIVALNRMTSLDFLTNSFETFSYKTGLYPGAVKVAELDGDGRPDIVVINREGRSFSILRNVIQNDKLGDSSFAVKTDFPTSISDNPNFIDVFDINMDNKPDIIVNYGNNTSFTCFINDPNVRQPPLITSISPTQGNFWSLVTINGKNFNVNKDENIVMFGTVTAYVASATADKLTVYAPPGSTLQPITVLNKENRLIGTSNAGFLNTFLSKEEITISDINPAVAYLGMPTTGMAYGDMNGDGLTDVITVGTTSSDNSGLTLHLNSSFNYNPVNGYKITFGEYGYDRAIKMSKPGSAVFTGDLDQDGKLDVVIAHNSSNSLTVIRNAGYPSYLESQYGSSKIELSTGKKPKAIALADVDGDGKIDILVTNADDNTVSIFKNTSAPGIFSFQDKKEFLVGAAPAGIEARDLNADGKVEIIVCNEKSNSVSILQNISNTTSINFADKIDFAVGEGPLNLEIADLNNDLLLDIVVNNSLNNTFSILENLGASNISAASFKSPIHIATGNFPVDLAAYDLNGDGFLEIVTSNAKDQTISVFRNTAATGPITTGSFVQKIELPSPMTSEIMIIDFDNDKKADIVTGNSLNGFSIFKNDPIIPSTIAVPTITSFMPKKATIGAQVTISGMNFKPVPSGNLVFFGTTRAEVIGASSTSLTVKVPPGAGIDQVSVTDPSNYLTGYSKTSFHTIFKSKNSFGVEDLATPVEIPILDQFSSFVVADMDGDGKQDLIKINSSKQTFSIYINKAKPGELTADSFEIKYTGSLPVDPRWLKVGDLNADGKPDLVFVTNYYNSLTCFINKSNGTLAFNEKFDVPVEFGIHNFEIGDIDEDGKPELIVGMEREGSFYSKYVRVFQNKSESGFISASSFSNTADFMVGRKPNSIRLKDVDGDSKPDLIVGNEYGTTGPISVLRNVSIKGRISTASFMKAIDLTLTSAPTELITEDFDDDGKADIIYGALSMFRNTATLGSITTSSFDQMVKIPFDYNHRFVATNAIDIDGDGKIDVLAASSYSSVFGVYRNQSIIGILDQTSFDPVITFKVNDGITGLLSTDIDNDGKSDVLMINQYKKTIDIYRNIGGFGTPEIASFTKVARKNDVVKITGLNLDGTTSVTLGGIPVASFTVVSPMEINAVVGNGASGRITVTNAVGVASKDGFVYIGAEGIASFSPTTAIKGSSITILGSDFSNATSVTFGGKNASSFVVQSPTTITAVVDAGETGDISVLTPIKTYKLAGFTFIPAPVISAISATVSGRGKTITITGLNFVNASTVTFGGTVASSFVVVSPTTITAVIGLGSTGNVEVTTPGGIAKYAGFTFVPAPIISSYGPGTGIAGKETLVTIYGENLTGTTSVQFGGVEASSFTVISDTQLTAVVNSAKSGNVEVSTIGGKAISTGFVFIEAPRIISFTPTTGNAGVMLSIIGENFTDITSISIGGVSITSYSNNSPKAILVLLDNAASGDIKVTNSAGTSTLSGFTFIPTPKITAISKNSGTIGDVITIIGTNFSGATSVKFGSVNASSFNIVSSTEITATVGNGATGDVTVATSGGSGSYYGFTFYGKPTITAISPDVASAGNTITITGTNFTGVTSVTFGGVKATSFTVMSNTVINARVGDGASGDVIVVTPGGTASFASFKYNFTLPVGNFKLGIIAATCKGSKSGSIKITTAQNLNYTATVVGNGSSTAYAFNTELDVNNLAAGTYNLCITVANQPSYKQCFNVVITEPKDLALFANINQNDVNVNLKLSGANIYYIDLNGRSYQTSESEITLALSAGTNIITLSSDITCQGTLKKTLIASSKITFSPNPVERLLQIDMGADESGFATIEIYSLSGERLYQAKKENNGRIEVDMENLAIGLYLIRVTTEKGTTSSKILKK